MEQFFKNPETLLRLHEGPLGPYIESFAKLLTDQGYAQCSARSCLRLVANFSRWLEQQRVTVEEITSEHIKQCVKEYTQQYCSIRGHAFTLQRFLDFLCQQGVIPKKTTPMVGFV